MSQTTYTLDPEYFFTTLSRTSIIIHVIFYLFFIFLQVDIDCVVGAWGKWDAPDRNTGRTQRMRKVEQKPLHNGAKCPALTESKIGGSIHTIQLIKSHIYV